MWGAFETSTSWARRAIGIITIILIVALGRVELAHAQCANLLHVPPPAIVIRLIQPTIAYHHDVDLFGLQKIGNVAERPPPGWVRLGVTHRSNRIEAQIRYRTVKLRDGRECIWLTNVGAVLGDPVLDVYVAANYKPGTCEYENILAHENTHVRFNMETLHDWLPTLKAALTEAVKKKFPAIFDAHPTDKELNEYVFENLDDVFTLMGEDNAKRDASIDTPENYRREHDKCRNWSQPGFRLD
jgi:hypothetical protein